MATKEQDWQAGQQTDMIPVVPMITRGEVITDNLIEFQGRGDSLTFRTPDPAVYGSRLPLRSRADLRDLQTMPFEEILDFLHEVGKRLDISKNEHMKLARELTYATSPHTTSLVTNAFNGIPYLFDRDAVRERAERSIGLAYLNGWVESELNDGTKLGVRAFGARSMHIIPGNSPIGGAQAIIRNAFTRSDCIIKTPSNSPFVAAAVAQTMCEIDPGHPVTRHVTVAYWRGGDADLEQRIYQPHNVEKIIAWGGFASVKHVTKYIQPGLELISLDPKYSGSVVQLAAIGDDEDARDVALRIAVDVGTANQTGCSCSRFVYVVTDGASDALERTNRLGELVYEELQGLPSGLSTPAKSFDAKLRASIDSARLQDEWYHVIGGERGEGCVIVSQIPTPVDFMSQLADRAVNIIPVETIDEVFPRFDAYTQTIGVWPEAFKAELIDIAPLYGVQRFVSLGYSANHTGAGPHDGLELERRMCKWIIDQRSQPIALAPSTSPERLIHPVFTPGTLEGVKARTQ